MKTKANIELPGYTQPISSMHLSLSRKDGIQKITVKIGGTNYTYDNLTPFKFESGKITTVNLEVGRDGILLNDVKITNWETSTPINGEALD